MAVTPGQRLARFMQRVAGGQAEVPVFPAERDLVPVTLSSYADPSLGELARLLGAFTRAGFAVIEAAEHPTAGALAALADRLGLGEAFVPPLYRMGHPTAEVCGVSVLSAPARFTGGSDHPFASTAGQRPHTDGTLQGLGEVTTTILLCHSPARSGGQSLLLNSTGAFVDLAREDRAAAAALMTPGVLVRSATINGCADSSAGPAFDVVGGRLLGRYSTQPTDRWQPEAADDQTALARALDFFTAAEQPGSGYHLELALRGGQGLLLANDRISHGRRPYRDDPAAPRVMLRGLFRHRPPRAASPADE
jgi:hypothetical protein